MARTDGTPLDDRRTYRVVLSDFLFTGGDGLGLSAVATKVDDLQLVDLEVLIAYLESLPQPITAPQEERLVARTAP